MARSSTPPIADDLVAQLRALDPIALLEKARANVHALAERQTAVQARLAAALEARAAADAPTRSPRVASLVVGARAQPAAAVPPTDEEIEAIRAEERDVVAAKSEQDRILRTEVMPAAKRAAIAHLRSHAAADLRRVRDAVLAFDAAVAGTDRVQKAMEALNLGTGALVSTSLPTAFDAVRSGADGLMLSERLALEAANIEKAGVVYPAPTPPKAERKRAPVREVEPTY